MKISLLKDILPACALLGTGGGAGVGGTYAVMSSSTKEEAKGLTDEQKRDINKRCSVADTKYTKIIKERSSYTWKKELELEAAEEGKRYCDWYHNSYYNLYDFNLKFKDV